MQSSMKLHYFCDVFVSMKHRITENGKCVEFRDVIEAVAIHECRHGCVVKLANQITYT